MALIACVAFIGLKYENCIVKYLDTLFCDDRIPRARATYAAEIVVGSAIVVGCVEVGRLRRRITQTRDRDYVLTYSSVGHVNARTAFVKGETGGRVWVEGRGNCRRDNIVTCRVIRNCINTAQYQSFSPPLLKSIDAVIIVTGAGDNNRWWLSAPNQISDRAEEGNQECRMGKRMHTNGVPNLRERRWLFKYYQIRIRLRAGLSDSTDPSHLPDRGPRDSYHLHHLIYDPLRRDRPVRRLSATYTHTRAMCHRTSTRIYATQSRSLMVLPFRIETRAAWAGHCDRIVALKKISNKIPIKLELACASAKERPEFRQFCFIVAVKKFCKIPNFNIAKLLVNNSAMILLKYSFHILRSLVIFYKYDALIFIRGNPKEFCKEIIFSLNSFFFT
ncbi:hypothetical protein PUN28_003268 [Cardiocondyla obscurior]|uniref:Uncharacterized protein n=1 Tax=Cardiocondyla obscurior TaxID=286306 RepID=A0AAW2GMG7_9HYME